MIIAVMVCLFLNDTVKDVLPLKITCGLITVGLIAYLLYDHQNKVFIGMAEITKEKLLVNQIGTKNSFTSM